MRYAILLLTAALAAPVHAAEQPDATAPLAGRLAALMTEQRLDTFAAHEPDTPDRFVAALLIPGAQLLVVASRYPTPSPLHTRIADRNYRDVYAALQEPAAQASRIFFVDLGCDGLQARPRDTVDVMYERGTTQTVFDGNWKKQGLSQDDYDKKFREADAEYNRLLRLLIAALEAKARA